MIISLRPESDFLDDYFNGLCLLFLLVLFLLIEELLVVKNLADRGLGIRRDFNEVEFELVGKLQRLLNGIDALLHVIAYEAHFLSADVVINCVEFLFLRP